MSQNMVALCDPDPHQKQITCLFASHNITFYWNPLTRFGYPANRQTNMKTYFAAVNKAEHMVLIISCLFCYIWMNKVFFFFCILQDVPILERSGKCLCIVLLLRLCTQHGCCWGYWILLSLWICICTWCLAFLCVTHPFQFYVNRLTGKDRRFSPSILSLQTIFFFSREVQDWG